MYYDILLTSLNGDNIYNTLFVKVIKMKQHKLYIYKKTQHHLDVERNNKGKMISRLERGDIIYQIAPTTDALQDRVGGPVHTLTS